MSEAAHVFTRFLDELSLLIDALGARLDSLEAISAEGREASLREVARLSGAIADLTGAFDVTDTALLGQALAHAASSGDQLDTIAPVVLPGARDTLTFFRWRLVGMRRAGNIPLLEQRARSLTQTLEATLLGAVLDENDLAHAIASSDDTLNELSPDELELVRSFATVELRSRDEEVDAHQLAEAAAAMAREYARRADRVNDEESSERFDGTKQLFVSETEEDLRELSGLIAAYGRDPAASAGQLNAIKRIAHKIKGTAPTIGLPEMTQLASYLEWSAHAFQRHLETPPDVVSVTLGRFLELFDTALVATASEESPGSDVVDAAKRLYDIATRAADSVPAAGDSSVRAATPVFAPFMSAGRAAGGGQQGSRDVALQVDSTRLDALMVHLSGLAVNRGALASAHSRVSTAQANMMVAINRLQEKSAHIVDAYQIPDASLPGSGASFGRDAGAKAPIGLAGQLDESWNEIEQDGANEVDSALRALTEVVADVEMLSATLTGALMQLDQLIEAQDIVISNLQQDATRMRLAPLADLAPRLEVVANYLASALGKRVTFTVEGEMTEIDRSLMRALAEPLNQLVRNAISHGIETPEERVEAGKPEVGAVWVHAYYAGTEVVIEVGDDGRGVNEHALVARAISNDVLDVERARSFTRDEALQLVFQPGVSTLDRPGALAGSGIGLDEVATIVQSLKGEISVAHTSEQGSLFRIRVPMTLTVLPALEVLVGEQAYTTPFSAVILSLADIRSSLRLLPEEAKNETQDTTSRKLTAFRLTLPSETPEMWSERARTSEGLLAGEEIPAYSLAECLGVSSDQPPGAALIVKRRGIYVALLVNGIGSTRDTIVRPLPSFLRRRLIRGVTIRAEDGAAAMLVDVGELVEQLLAGDVQAPLPTPQVLTLERPVERVLIVDDSVTIRRALDQMLKGAGFATALASDGFEALEMMKAELPRVIILDVEMPRLNGYELLEIMRDSPKYAQVRVAMLTSRAGARHERHARDLGADEYLVKPCPQDTLISAVKRLLTDSEIA